MAHYGMVLRGAITGSMWWPVGERGGIPISIDIGRERDRVDDPTLRDVLDHVLMEKGGDFSGAQFTADTELLVLSDRGTTNRTHMRRTRYWPITAFPNVADLVAEDSPECYSMNGED